MGIGLDGQRHMQEAIGRIVLGFIAAVIAVAIVHEGIIYGLTQAGWIRGAAWGLQPIPLGAYRASSTICSGVAFGVRCSP